MNFEPCNPPLIDPLYLSGVTLLTDIFKPITLRQQDLKIRLFPEKMSPIRPVPVRPHSTNILSLSPQPTSPILKSSSTYTSHNFSNVTTSSPLSCFRPLATTSQSPDEKATTSEDSTFTPTCTSTRRDELESQGTNLSPSRTDTSQQFDINTDISREISVQTYTPTAYTRMISPVQSSITSANSRKISPVQSYTTPAYPRKISPVQCWKKSPRSSPYSPKSSPESTPVANKSDKRKNERHEISEFQSNILKKWFNSYTYLTTVMRTEVSKDTGLPQKTVMYWFQNQRRKVKRETSVKS